MSVDGHLDDRTDHRLILSGPEDLDRVDAARADHDAILVGANTLRRDDPRLLVRSEERRAARRSRGLPPDPLKVTVTRGDLDPGLRVWHSGGEKLVYCPQDVAAGLRERLGGLAEVVGLGAEPDPVAIVEDLGRRGVTRLMVEGGQQVLTAFLVAGVGDELRLAVAPFFVGDPQAPSFVGAGAFPHGPAHPMELTAVEVLGGVAVLHYRLGREAADE
jgi:riboflavin-specific deaminase-like protein